MTQRFGSVCDVDGCEQPATITFWDCLVCEEHGDTNRWRFTKRGAVLYTEERD